MTKYKLRQYQEEAVITGINAINNNKREILVLPTGSGKSLVVASIAKELDGNTIVFQPNKEILEQNLEKIKNFGFDDVGVFSASMNQKTVGKVTFATIGTIYNKPEMWGMFNNIIIDEVHLCNSKAGMYQEFIKSHKGAVVGLTATPYRMHSFENLSLGKKSVVAKFLTRTKPKIFNTISHITQIQDLYNQGFLCPLEYIVNEKYFPSEIKLNSTGLDFDEKSLKEYHASMNIVDIVEDAIKGQNKRHILVFNKFINEAQNLNNKLSDLGIKSAIVTAETPKKEREEIIKKFKSQEIKVITNVGVLTTGFDFPELDCVILARPTQSVALYYQMVGRALRTSPDKQNATVIDICGNVRRFGRVETFSITRNEFNGLPRLKSEVGFLTGFDFLNQIDLETKPKSNKSDSDIVTFGKYGKANNGKGTPIKDIPTSYLLWCIDNFQDGFWKEKFKKEVDIRVNNK